MALAKDITNTESLRNKTLECARNFKSSWIELGQFLCAIYQDKLYRDWGYLTFEAYCTKEIGIRQPTAVKLLKSYSFLEDEEPAYLKNEVPDKQPHQIPSVDSVNALRLFKANDQTTAKDYQAIRGEVLDRAGEDKDVKKKIKYILKTRSGKSEQDIIKDEKIASFKRLLTGLRTARTQMNELQVPEKIIKQIDALVDSLSSYNP